MFTGQDVKSRLPRLKSSHKSPISYLQSNAVNELPHITNDN
jgi:hypothetical protein